MSHEKRIGDCVIGDQVLLANECPEFFTITGIRFFGEETVKLEFTHGFYMLGDLDDIVTVRSEEQC